MLSTVAHVVEKMNQLMLQLRIGSTPIDKPRPIDLAPLVARVCAAKPGADGRIDVELAACVIAIGHEERLEHVIGHLLQNALDATAAGGRVTVRLFLDGRFAAIEVADTGPGMASGLSPQDADIRLHFAKALLKSGDKAGAKTELEAVAVLTQASPARAEAQQMLKEL